MHCRLVCTYVVTIINIIPWLQNNIEHRIFLVLLIFCRTVSIDCATAQTKIIQQINDWDNEDCETKPGDTEPHGQKCLYKVKHLEKIQKGSVELSRRLWV